MTSLVSIFPGGQSAPVLRGFDQLQDTPLFAFLHPRQPPVQPQPTGSSQRPSHTWTIVQPSQFDPFPLNSSPSLLPPNQRSHLSFHYHCPDLSIHPLSQTSSPKSVLHCPFLLLLHQPCLSTTHQPSTPPTSPTVTRQTCPTCFADRLIHPTDISIPVNHCHYRQLLH